MPDTSRAHAAAPFLVLLGMLCQEAGAAIAVMVFPTVGPVAMVALRLVFSALVLLLIARHALRGAAHGHWPLVIGYGVTLAAMNVMFYLAIARIPLGIAVTIEVLGPLVLSVVASRSLRGLLWAVTAAAGVALLGGTAHDLDLLGVAFAVGAALLWAGYILLARAAGAAMAGLTGLALATGVGAVLTLPAAVVTAGAALADPRILALGLAVAVLSSAIPYGIEITALRRLRAETFGILMALAPALAALTGLVLLGQPLTVTIALGIALVTVAGIGAVRTAPRPTRVVAPDQATLPLPPA
ncbi:EamA family transporter [Demequina lignilytica]|uniref:EamA family transporter n=1 Tax=Demequina lignilytica TaxID=3051663 RepID=A0AB35MFJ4_9MICO|nr:EamA family transporter [Demequina sp. SYSU T0a273]MDN4482524.1 EamA family transporter [Demequina sp. SYSU T0a273]